MIQLTKEKYNELQNNLAKMFPACEDKNGLMAIAMAAINYYEEEAYLSSSSCVKSSASGSSSFLLAVAVIA